MNGRSEKRNLDIPRDWQLTRRFKCPTCGKRYAVVEWKSEPKCRQCGDALYCEDSQGKPSSLVSVAKPLFWQKI
jgi:transcription elongation factor Elf1